jgi:phage gp36-like protein
MTYATLDDLINRAGPDEIRQVADRDLDGLVDAAVIAAVLASADRMVDGYVGARYDLPLAEVPALVNTWATSIARYQLHAAGAPDYVVQDYKDAITALKDVSRGLIVLPLPSGAVAAPDTGGSVLAEHPAEVFTSSRLRGW